MAVTTEKTSKKRAVKSLSSVIFKIVSFIFIWVIGISIGFSVANTLSGIAHNPPLLRLYNEAVPAIFIILTTLLFVYVVEKHKLTVWLSKSYWRDTMLGLGFGVVWIGSAVAILMVTNTLHINHRSSVQSLYIWIIALFLNTLMQELLVRGYIFSLLKQKYSTVAAVIVTTLLFTAIHGPDFGAYGILLLNTVTASIFFSLLLIYTRGLWAPIIAHFAWNLVGGIVLSGVVLADDYPSIFQISLSGSPLMNGGVAKIEGGIVVLLLNLVLIAVLAYLLKRRSNTIAR